MPNRRPKLSKGELLRMQRLAAEEFFLHRNRPMAQYRSLQQEPIPKPQEAPSPSDLPRDGSILNIEDSKELLRRLAAGEIKQMRKR